MFLSSFYMRVDKKLTLHNRRSQGSGRYGGVGVGRGNKVSI